MNIQSKYEQQNIDQCVSETDSYTIERYLQFFKGFPRPTVRVLDVGCNTGRGGRLLKERDPDLQIYGLDCVQSRLDRLPEIYEDGVYGIANQIPVEDCFYDVVLAGEFIEHLYPSDVDSTLSEFQRVLRIGGRLLLTTPNPNYLKNRLQHRSVYGVSHLTQHFPEVLRYRLKMHGFSKVKTRGSGKVTRYLGEHFPLRIMYGSLLYSADKW